MVGRDDESVRVSGGGHPSSPKASSGAFASWIGPCSTTNDRRRFRLSGLSRRSRDDGAFYADASAESPRITPRVHRKEECSASALGSRRAPAHLRDRRRSCHQQVPLARSGRCANRCPHRLRVRTTSGLTTGASGLHRCLSGRAGGKAVPARNPTARRGFAGASAEGSARVCTLFVVS